MLRFFLGPIHSREEEIQQLLLEIAQTLKAVFEGVSAFLPWLVIYQYL